MVQVRQTVVPGCTVLYYNKTAHDHTSFSSRPHHTWPSRAMGPTPSDGDSRCNAAPMRRNRKVGASTALNPGPSGADRTHIWGHPLMT